MMLAVPPAAAAARPLAAAAADGGVVAAETHPPVTRAPANAAMASVDTNRFLCMTNFLSSTDPPVTVALFIVLSSAAHRDQSAGAGTGGFCGRAATTALAISVRRISRKVTGTPASPVSPVTQNAHWNPPVS